MDCRGQQMRVHEVAHLEEEGCGRRGPCRSMCLTGLEKIKEARGCGKEGWGESGKLR